MSVIAEPELVPGTQQMAIPIVPGGAVKHKTRPAATLPLLQIVKRGREYVTRQMGRPTVTGASMMLARRHLDKFLDEWVGLRHSDRAAAVTQYLRTCCIPDKDDIAIAETYKDTEVLERIARGTLSGAP
jgi:hypothetical protein